jgi:hypothetical protein|tara:strand:- start:2924 stop:3904 length:981 start_codon:yes stop_codon:yes gene_type:complete
MSEAQTNPEGEVTEPKLNMFDVMFGSDEDTNPERAVEEPSDYEDPETEAAEELYEATEDEEVESEEIDYEVDEEVTETETPVGYTVKVDGEEIEVNLDELRNGYQRQADYTRKSQSLAEQRKAVEANLNAVQQEREQYAQILGNMAENQNAELQRFANMDWADLKETDPMEYMEKRLEYQESKEKIAEVHNERVRVQQQTETEMGQFLQEKLHKEAELLSKALPEYTDPGSNFKDEVRNYALELGFSPEDIDGIADHRVILVLHKAMMQDRVPAKKSKQAAPKVVKSGTPQTKAQRSRRTVQAKRERLAKTGNQRDAANVFLDFIS